MHCLPIAKSTRTGWFTPTEEGVAIGLKLSFTNVCPEINEIQRDSESQKCQLGSQKYSKAKERPNRGGEEK